MEESTPRCPNGSIVLTHSGNVNVLPARCNRWNCKNCGPRKARRLRARLEQTNPSRLITLTLRPDPSLTPAEMLQKANRAWSILWRRYRRRFGAKARGYAKIVELTKAGTPHLHIIASVPFIHHRQLSAEWRELTGSYIVDIRVVKKSKGISGYLTSYLTKALEVPRGMRKWSAARAYVPPEPERELAEGEIPPDARYERPRALVIIATYLQAGYEMHGDWLFPPGAYPQLLGDTT